MSEQAMNQPLQEYVESRSPAAFRLLVDRHVHAVHAQAIRQTGDAELAADVTQAVFVLLAQRASTLSPKVVLGGWLHNATRYTCLTALRAAKRRRHHEQQAARMKPEVDRSQADLWRDVSPMLDDALARVGQRDRDAIVLRFFEGRSIAEVGEALGVSENTAKQRVARAVDRVRRQLARLGVVAPAATFVVLMEQNAVQAAPAAVAERAAEALVSPIGSATLVNGAIRMMNWTKIKLAAAVVLMVAAGGAGVAVALSQAGEERAVAAPVATNAGEVVIDPDLQGTWQLAIPGGKPLTVVIDGTVMRHSIPGEEEAIIDLVGCDPTATPRELDGVVAEGSELRGQPSEHTGLLGLMAYEFDSEGLLYLALSKPGSGVRPDTTTPGPFVKVMVLRKVAGN